MAGSRSQKTLSAFLAVVLLSLAVVSRAPQSKCRCHERRQSSSRPLKQEQKPCVFGQLRSLTASYVLPATVGPDEQRSVASVPAIINSLAGLAPHVGIDARPRARSPPAVVVL